MAAGDIEPGVELACLDTNGTLKAALVNEVETRGPVAGLQILTSGSEVLCSGRSRLATALGPVRADQLAVTRNVRLEVAQSPSREPPNLPLPLARRRHFVLP